MLPHRFFKYMLKLNVILININNRIDNIMGNNKNNKNNNYRCTKILAAVSLIINQYNYVVT